MPTRAPRRSLPRRALLVPVSVLTVVVVASGCASGPGLAGSSVAGPRPPSTAVPAGEPSPSSRVHGESVRFELEPATERTFRAHRIEWKAQNPDKGSLPGYSDGSDTVALSIDEGTVDTSGMPVRGRVSTSGMARLVHAGTELEFVNPDVDLTGGTVRATLDGRRVTLFELDTTRARREDLPGALPHVVDVSGRFSEEVRRAVDERFGVSLPPDRLTVSAELSLRYEPS